jgi:hypothetical protein
LGRRPADHRHRRLWLATRHARSLGEGSSSRHRPHCDPDRGCMSADCEPRAGRGPRRTSCHLLTVLMPTRPRRNVCSAFVRGHRFAEDELAAKPKLLPGALALRTDAVCVLSYRPLDLRFVLAVRADHPWTELQRRHIEQDRDSQTDNNYRHRVTALRSSMRF